MRFGLFGSAQARRPTPGTELTDSSQGFREWIENNVEAEALGFHSTFVVEHHFTGFGQVSASLNLLTWLGARTSTLRLGTAVLVLPWHNPVLLAEQAALGRRGRAARLQSAARAIRSRRRRHQPRCAIQSRCRGARPRLRPDGGWCRPRRAHRSRQGRSRGGARTALPGPYADQPAVG